MSTTVLKSKPEKKIGIFSTGLALFSMFFGAGNLIFPLIVGQISGEQTPFAVLGLGLSAVAFPFLGLMAMMFYGGEIHAFLSRLGKWPAVLLLFILQMSQGPLGAMPRLVTLMHASIKSYLPFLSLSSFSVLICGALFLLAARPQRIVDILGKVLTPFLLLTLALLVIVGLIDAPSSQSTEGSGAFHFILGLKMGYQTTDLIAALLFATLVLPHLAEGTDALSPEERKWVIQKRMRGASLIASFLLMASYIGLCWISAHHSWTLSPSSPEELLQKIAAQILGPWGGIVASVAIFLACFTTAISLAAVFSHYLRDDLLAKKGGRKFSLFATLLITAAAANLGFSGIVQLWGPILEVLYPALIVLCLVNIAHHLYKIQSIEAPVFFALGLAIGGFFC